MNESPAGPQAGYGLSQYFGRRRRTVEDWKAAIGRRTANGQRLRKLGGKVNVIIELSRELKGQQPAPDNQARGNDGVWWLSTEQANEMPNGTGVKQQRKEEQPTPEWQRAIRLLTEDSMGMARMSNAEDEEVEAHPGSQEKPATLDQPEGNEDGSQQNQQMPVTHGVRIGLTIWLH